MYFYKGTAFWKWAQPYLESKNKQHHIGLKAATN